MKRFFFSQLLAICAMVMLLGAAAPARAADANAGDITQFIDPLVLDEYNPDVTDATRGTAEPQRGGTLRVRMPSDFGDLNPITANSQPDRLAQLMMFDQLAGQDLETMEFYPRMAWSYAKGDLLKTKDGEVQEGTFLELGDEHDPNSEVAFIPGAWRVTVLKYDTASVDKAAGKLTLSEKWGSKVLEGEITEHKFTYEVNEAKAPGAAEKTVRVKMSDLDSWKDQIGGEDIDRPYRKQECAFKFFIRPDIQWHDGSPFTGADVKFSYDTIMNINVNAQGIRSYLQDVTSCDLQDDGMTVHFQSRKPYFSQFDVLAGMYLVPRHVFRPEQFGGDEKAFGEAFDKHLFRTKPIGVGPYKFAEWKTGSSLSLARNDHYWASELPEGAVPKWSPEQPYMDRIEFIVIPEKGAALKELEKGNLDADMDVEPDTWFLDQTNTEAFTSKIVRAQRYGFLYTYIALNNEDPVLSQWEARRALAMLVPTARIDKDIFGNLSTPVSGPFYSHGPGYDRDVPLIEYDPKEAKRLLRKNGWLDRDKDGVIEKEINGQMVPFEIEYIIHTARDYHQKVADIIKESVEQVGIKFTIRKVDFNVLLEKTRDKDFQTARIAWGTSLDPDPYQIWHSSQIKNNGDNYISYRNDMVDDLCVKIREEFNPAKRWAMAREVHRIIAEDQPVVFRDGFSEVFFYSRGIQGVKFYPSQYAYDFTEWWWADAAKRK